MRFFALFIYRPVATILIAAAITLCGILGFRLLPVAPLPQVDFPVIMVSASLPGASPETMASSVATPLERSLGRIAGVNEMTSSSSLGSTRIFSNLISIVILTARRATCRPPSTPRKACCQAECPAARLIARPIHPTRRL